MYKMFRAELQGKQFNSTLVISLKIWVKTLNDWRHFFILLKLKNLL